MENPSLEELLALKRIELIDLASHLGVSNKKYFKQQQILDEIIVNLVDNEILEEEAMEYVSKELSEAIKIKQMELEMQREIEEKKIITEREIEEKKIITEREIEEKKIITETEIEREKLSILRKRLERQRDREAQAYIEKEKLQHFDITKHIRFVSPFSENEDDKHFLLFEKVAKDLDWPKSY